MSNIFLALAQYVVILVAIAAIAGLGIFFGISWRKKKNAEDALTEANQSSEE